MEQDYKFLDSYLNTVESSGSFERTKADLSVDVEPTEEEFRRLLEENGS